MRAKNLITNPVVTVAPDTPVKEAARLLAAHGFAALPVVALDDHLLGVVSEADLLRNRIPPDPRALIHDRAPAPTGTPPPTVAGVMTSDIVVAVIAGASAGVVDVRITEGTTAERAISDGGAG